MSYMHDKIEKRNFDTQVQGCVKLGEKRVSKLQLPLAGVGIVVNIRHQYKSHNSSNSRYWRLIPSQSAG